MKDERDPNLLKIPLGLRDLLKVFFWQNLEYNYIINSEEGK